MRDTFDERFMAVALEEAKKAFALGEIPVGACVVKDGEIVATGHNQREQTKQVSGHAEMIAINGACERLGDWRLSGCQLYVTLEPCPMCAGAIINARIDRVIYGAEDEVMGSFGSVCNLAAMPYSAHPKLTKGVLENECRALLQQFFKERRE